MTTIAEPSFQPFGQQHLVLDGVSWRLYQTFLDEIGDRPLRVSFHRGTLEIMSPLPKHEKWKRRIGRMIEIIALELNIPLETLGSTTFAREDEQAGLEPDECYYVQHAAAVRGKDRLELPADPPPDVAVEVDITSRSIAREPIYADLGVPELWRFDGTTLHFLHLQDDKTYGPRERSAAFPFLQRSDLQRFLDMTSQSDDTTVLRAFQQWVWTLKVG